MTDILSELFHKVEEKDTDALTPIQKAQRYIQLDISGQSDKAMELAKDGVTAKQIQSAMLKALAGLMKDPKEKIELSTKAEKILFALQSDKKEEVEKEILRSGKTVKDVLAKAIEEILDKIPEDKELELVSNVFESQQPENISPDTWEKSLHWATYYGESEFLKRLINAAPSSLLTNDYKDNLLRIATKEYQEESAEILLSIGADPQSKKHGYSAIALIKKGIAIPTSSLVNSREILRTLKQGRKAYLKEQEQKAKAQKNKRNWLWP